MRENISLKSNARKTLSKKDFTLVLRLIRTLSRRSFTTDFFINTIFVYVLTILWDSSYFIV